MIVCTSNNFQIMVVSVLHRGTMSNCEEDANRPRPHFPHNQKPCGSESWSASSNLCPGHLVAADGNGLPQPSRQRPLRNRCESSFCIPAAEMCRSQVGV